MPVSVCIMDLFGIDSDRNNPVILETSIVFSNENGITFRSKSMSNKFIIRDQNDRMTMNIGFTSLSALYSRSHSVVFGNRERGRMRFGGGGSWQNNRFTPGDPNSYETVGRSVRHSQTSSLSKKQVVDVFFLPLQSRRHTNTERESIG